MTGPRDMDWFLSPERDHLIDLLTAVISNEIDAQASVRRSLREWPELIASQIVWMFDVEPQPGVEDIDPVELPDRTIDYWK